MKPIFFSSWNCCVFLHTLACCLYRFLFTRLKFAQTHSEFVFFAIRRVSISDFITIYLHESLCEQTLNSKKSSTAPTYTVHSRTVYKI